MRDFEIEQRRAARQLKAFNAALMIRKIMGWADPRPGTVDARVEEIRVATISAIAESRAVMQALKDRNVITEREAQAYLDFGYDSILAQVEAGSAAKLYEGI